MDERLKQAMRAILLDRYGLDILRRSAITPARITHLFFQGKTYMIRASMTP